MNNYINIISKELERSIKTIDKIKKNKTLLNTIYKVANLCTHSISDGGKLIFAGNGGSAADCQHIAAEFIGRFKHNRKPLAALALTTDSSIITSIGNDFGFKKIFYRQLQAIGKKGDVLFLYSTSGKSSNVISLLALAKKMNIHSVCLIGNYSLNFDDVCDYILKVPSLETNKIQECHAIIGHIICQLVEENFKEN